MFVRTDVASTEDVSNLVTRTIERFGRLDYAFNCGDRGHSGGHT
jgi:NAD(P)-dependent dehydrogenase (short-subunit alcohol dehydrogenase family)